MFGQDGKKRAILCDLDGTLCDISHRFPLFQAGKQKEFEAEVLNDSSDKMVGSFLNFARFRGYEIVFLSARSEDLRNVTQAWLAEHFPGFERFPVFLKGRKDFRADDQIKREIYNTEVKPRYDVALVLEDRSSVVSMWRELGLKCWQVAAGDY